MKISVIVHEAEEGGTGRKSPLFPGVPRRAKPSRSSCTICTKRLKAVSLDDWPLRHLLKMAGLTKADLET